MPTETNRQVAERIAKAHVNWPQGYKAFARAVAAIEAALDAERERALLDAARQECVFCAGVGGYNSTPVQAALPAETDAGSYVHRITNSADCCAS